MIPVPRNPSQKLNQFTLIGEFPGHELDRFTGKLILNKAFSRKMIFHKSG